MAASGVGPMLTSVVVVPSTPLVLEGHPGIPHDAISQLRRQIDRAVGELADSDTVVIIAGGPRGSGIRLRAQVDAAGAAVRQGYGIDRVCTDVPRPRARPGVGTAERIAATTRIMRRRSDAELPVATHAEDGWADADVLVSHAAQAAPDATLVAISVAPDAGPEDALEIAATIAEDGDSRTAMLVAGDLSAGHGTKPPRPGATIVLDDQVLGALDSGQPDRLLHVGQELAADSQSRAVGALRVLGAVLADTALGMVVRWHGAPLGVGYVVAVGR